MSLLHKKNKFHQEDPLFKQSVSAVGGKVSSTQNNIFSSSISFN